MGLKKHLLFMGLCLLEQFLTYMFLCFGLFFYLHVLCCLSMLQKAIVPFLQHVFMPIVSTIFRALTTTIDERDQVSQTERKLLQRGYFTFISTLVNNNVTEVLSTQGMHCCCTSLLLVQCVVISS